MTIETFIVTASQLADAGGTIQAADAVVLFPGQPTLHTTMSIRQAVRAQFPRATNDHIDDAFERVLG